MLSPRTLLDRIRISFLAKNTIFFEYGSGCSTFIAKYYTKKSYAVEGNIKWYNIGINNGLKDILLFKDLKCDGTGRLLSYPGKKSKLKDWKQFFQAYKKEYNADVILIDGRFRVACGLDIFNKIRNDTIVLIHDYINIKNYHILENYYLKLEEWDSLIAFIKRPNISFIPTEIYNKYIKIPKI